MKRNPQTVEIVRRQLREALAGVEDYLKAWPQSPQDFTTEVELQTFVAKLREMQESLDRGDTVPILGLWRITETWPYKNEIRRKIVQAELAYERLK